MLIVRRCTQRYCWLLSPDSLRTAKITKRSAKDASSTKEDKFSWSQVLCMFADLKTCVCPIVYILGLIVLQGITLSMPEILKDVEQWTPLQIQRMTIPSNIAAFVAILFFSRSSD